MATPFASGPTNTYHLWLASLTGKPAIDMTPCRDMTYPQAREELLAFELLFPSLHEPGSPSYLAVRPCRGDREALNARVAKAVLSS